MRGWIIASVSLCLLAAVLAGCETGNGVTNVAGTYEQYFAADPQAVTKAAEEVAHDLGLVVISSAATNVDGRVVARTAQDRKITIDVDKEGENVSLASVRVGVLSDESLSLDILQKMKAKVQSAPAPKK